MQQTVSGCGAPANRATTQDLKANFWKRLRIAAESKHYILGARVHQNQIVPRDTPRGQLAALQPEQRKDSRAALLAGTARMWQTELFASAR